MNSPLPLILSVSLGYSSGYGRKGKEGFLILCVSFLENDKILVLNEVELAQVGN
jgi:hypothetical protein